jgi:flagellar assembly factor FliW
LVFDVKYPVLGFENVASFEFDAVDDNFATMRALDNGGIPSFTLVNPFVLREYSFDIPSSIKALMDIKENSNLLVYLILIVKRPFNESLANFLAPIVFNIDNKTMSQVVLDEMQYPDYFAAEPLSKFITE